MNYLFDNILESGSIMASPSTDPDYRFHWVRDAAIVIKSIITLYKENPLPKYMRIFENYIMTEREHIKHHPAEPKFNLDKSPYTGDWGRPQNDGPAMRGIVCLKLLKIMPQKFAGHLLKIIRSDLSYTIDEIDQPCFDLWEEEFGYHIYTRMVQTKFIMEALHYPRVVNNESKLSQATFERAIHYLSHHFTVDGINASYNTQGQISRKYDASFLLALSHVDYKLPLLDNNSKQINNYITTMTEEFKKIYPISHKLDIPLLGRYLDDKYFDGNPWIITTIALYQYWNKSHQPLEGITQFLTLLKEKKMDLPEQLERTTGTDCSVEKLTWNYAELITLMDQLNFFSLSLL